MVAEWNEADGRGWILTKDFAPIYARCYDVKSLGQSSLMEDMVVEFEVRSQRKDAEAGLYAAQISAPGKERICIETGKTRKELIKTGKTSRILFRLGVVKSWSNGLGNISCEH